MAKKSKTSFTVVADNPKTGAQVIEAQLPEGDVPRETRKLKKAGMKAVKVVPTRDPFGNAG